MRMTFDQVTEVIRAIQITGLLSDWRVTTIVHHDGPLWESWWITLCRRDDPIKQGIIVDFAHWCQFFLGAISEEQLLEGDYVRIEVEAPGTTVDADRPRNFRALRAPER